MIQESLSQSPKLVHASTHTNHMRKDHLHALGHIILPKRIKEMRKLPNEESYPFDKLFTLRLVDGSPPQALRKRILRLYQASTIHDVCSQPVRYVMSKNALYRRGNGTAMVLWGRE